MGKYNSQNTLFLRSISNLIIWKKCPKNHKRDIFAITYNNHIKFRKCASHNEKSISGTINYLFKNRGLPITTDHLDFNKLH